ncbi:MAG: hypothetical protein GX607_07245 [Myxococcales bacterium]|nr:hypothetical protein [Myxococcales bacterium]
MARQAPPLREEQVTTVFRALAEEHIRTRRKERETAELTWRRIQQRQQAERLGIRPAPAARPSWARRLLWIGVPALAIAAGVALMVDGGPPPGLEYELVGGHSQGELITTEDEPAKLLFSDDSSIEAAKHTVLNVHVVGERKLVTRLSQGKVTVHVVPNPETHWRFLAGPYEVEVVGTRFDLSWDADRGRFALVMHQGRVVVTGPGEKPRRLGAGEVLILDEHQQVVDATEAAPLDALPGEASDPAVTAKREDPRSATRRGPGAPSDGAGEGVSEGRSAGPSWREQVASGKFEDVVRSAQREGVEQVLARRDATELQALAQAARYTGNTKLAVQAWTTIRKRFAGQAASAQAAFFLGRIDDQMGRPEQALRWFDTYLSEAPTGVYASETLGRKLTLIRATRGDDKAREVAREYVARFPHGPYADTARDILLND